MNDKEAIVDQAIKSLDRSIRDIVPEPYKKKARRIYISGPMTGISNENREEFERVELLLEGEGVNPHKLNHNHGKTWQEYMKVDLKALLCCDSILMLKGWQNSKGACLEKIVAESCGIPVFFDP